PPIVNNLAPWYCSQINQAVYNAWHPWIPIATLAILVSFFIGVLIFMSGLILNSEKVRTYGIGEIYEALATAIIVIMFMLIAAVMMGLIPGFVVGPIDPYNTSLVYINNTISSAENLFTALFNTNMAASFYASFGIDISSVVYASLITGVFSQAILILYVLPAQAIGAVLVQGLLVLHIEFYLILFFMYASIPVFLIPGIIFRALLPTRALGGMLIAISIGFYLIMPLLFSIAYFFTNTTVLSSLNQETAAINAYGGGANSQANAVSPTSPLVETLGNIQSSMGAFWLSVLFYPALITAATYMAVITIAEFIGGFAHKTAKVGLL
ncbi:MAG: hypothetical protein ACP5K9_01390, partial [Candidatus Micrarchaeia archaeon]